MKWISAWAIYKDSIGKQLEAQLRYGLIETSDTVWRGPNGDAVVTSDITDLDEDYADYTEAGTVSEYLD